MPTSARLPARSSITTTAKPATSRTAPAAWGRASSTTTYGNKRANTDVGMFEIIHSGASGRHAPLLQARHDAGPDAEDHCLRPLAEEIGSRQDRRMHPLVVLNIVGLTPELIGAHTPNLCALRPARRPARTAHRHAGRDLLGAGDIPHRLAAQRATAPSATAGCSATSMRSGSGGSPTGCSPASASGTPARSATPRSPAPTCSGGTTWRRAPTIAVTPRPIYKADGRKTSRLLRAAVRSCATS